MRFLVVVHKDETNEYGVTVPDLPVCFSAGDNLADVIGSAHEAIRCHLEGLLMDGERLPELAPLGTHRANKAYKGGI